MMKRLYPRADYTTHERVHSLESGSEPMKITALLLLGPPTPWTIGHGLAD